MSAAASLSGRRLCFLPALVALVLAALLSPVVPAASAGMVTVIVSKLHAGNEPERLVRYVGGRVVRDLSIIDGFIARVPASSVPALEAAPNIRSVTPNRSLHLLGFYGQDSGAASAVYPDVVRASKDWASGDTGKGVTVAVVDTGVDTSGDLAGQVVHAEDFTSDGDGSDRYGHGTFVAGLIDGTGANSNGSIEGVAPGAKLVSLKISGADGSTDVTLVLEALEWIEDFKSTYNIRVVNLSLGFQSQQSYRIDPLDFAVERLWSSGVVVVTAAGNGGNTPGTILTPGNDPYVITVGAINDRTTVSTWDDKLATFSASGPTVDGLAKPDVLAPGKSVVSSRSPGSTVDVANPSSEIGSFYARASGTSFATAIVSGVAAIVIGHTQSLTPDQVKERIVSTARPIAAGTTPATGSGLVDAWAAARSTDMSPANVGNVPSQGGGSLQATRGPACLIDQTTGACLSDADANALLGFDPSAYFSNTWAGSQWVGSQWVGSQWVGNAWAGSQWVGSQWVGSQWVGSQWVGSQWVGSQWVGSQWAMAGGG